MPWHFVGRSRGENQSRRDVCDRASSCKRDRAVRRELRRAKAIQEIISLGPILTPTLLHEIVPNQICPPAPARHSAANDNAPSAPQNKCSTALNSVSIESLSTAPRLPTETRDPSKNAAPHHRSC